MRSYKLTVLTACCLTSGAIGGFVLLAFERNSWTGFVLGSLIPPGPLLLYYSSTYVLHKELQQLLKLKDDKLITEDQFRALRQGAADYYRQIRFGQPSLADLPAEDGS